MATARDLDPVRSVGAKNGTRRGDSRELQRAYSPTNVAIGSGHEDVRPLGAYMLSLS